MKVYHTKCVMLSHLLVVMVKGRSSIRVQFFSQQTEDFKSFRGGQGGHYNKVIYVG